jgi:hypothetical protein
MARNASSLRRNGSVWNLRGFCRAGERRAGRTHDPDLKSARSAKRLALRAERIGFNGPYQGLYRFRA